MARKLQSLISTRRITFIITCFTRINPRIILSPFGKNPDFYSLCSENLSDSRLLLYWRSSSIQLMSTSDLRLPSALHDMNLTITRQKLVVFLALTVQAWSMPTQGGHPTYAEKPMDRSDRENPIAKWWITVYIASQTSMEVFFYKEKRKEKKRRAMYSFCG